MPGINSLSVVIPMYNEELCAEDAISEASRVLSSLPLEYEIIAVNDHSCDNTARVLENLARADQKIKIVNNPARSGLGGSLRAGFLRAEGEAVFYTDADLPCNFDEIRSALSLMERNNADIVSAYKSDYRNYGARRMVYSIVYNKLINFLFKINLKDVNFSFKLFRRDKLNRLDLKSEGSFINAELFAKARAAGYVITEFPVNYTPRKKGSSKLDNFWNIKKIICELLSFIGSGKLPKR
jgi:glycosyltransferase involved in cell wall biosynthesis